MPTTSTTEATCPGCGRRFRLRPEALGKKVKCNCGAVFVAADASASPASPVTDDDLLDEAPAPPPAGLPPRPKPPVAPPKKNAVVEALLAGEDDAQLSSFRERWFPGSILVIGFIGHIALWACWVPGPLEVAICASLAMLVQVLFFAPAMLGSLTLLAKWFDVSLGSLPSVAWKIIALTLGPAAVADVLFTATLILANFDWEIIAAGFGFYLVLYGICAAIVFELGVAETAFLVLINFVPRVAAAYPAAVVLEQLTWVR